MCGNAHCVSFRYIFGSSVYLHVNISLCDGSFILYFVLPYGYFLFKEAEAHVL